MNRSWSADAEVEIPPGGASGPILVMGGDTNGWSLYLNAGKPTFCYNLGAVELTYIRATEAVPTGKHFIRYEFEKRGTEKFGAGGVGRLFIDGEKVAEGRIPKTSAFGYSLDETFDVGCDKGAPVTDEYPPLAAFTGKIVRIDIDLKPDLAIDVARHGDEKMKAALLRQ
jgi:arylsulfatase